MLRVAAALVALALVVAGCPGEPHRLGDGQEEPEDGAGLAIGWQAGDPVPTFTMTRKEVTYVDTGEPAWLFTVSDVRRAPIPYDVVIIKIQGCAWYDQSERGNVEVSDTILCRDHDVLTVVHAPSGQRMYSNCNGCGTPVPPVPETESDPPEEDWCDAWPWYVCMDTTTTDDPPTFRIDDMEGEHRWSELEIQSHIGELRVKRNDPAHTRDMPFTDEWVALWDSPIRRGDTLHFCSLEHQDDFSVSFQAAGSDKWSYGWGSSGVPTCSATQPAISWSVSQADASAMVTAADSNADWSEFEISFHRAGRLGINDDPRTTSGAGEGVDTDYTQLPTKSIGGGDKLYFCVSGTAGFLEATLRHIASDTIAREFTYNSAPPCA